MLIRISVVFVCMLMMNLCGCKFFSRLSHLDDSQDEEFCQQYHRDLYDDLRSAQPEATKSTFNLTKQSFLDKISDDSKRLKIFNSYLSCKLYWADIGNDLSKTSSVINDFRYDKSKKYKASKTTNIQQDNNAVYYAMENHRRNYAGEIECLVQSNNTYYVPVTSTNQTGSGISHDDEFSGLGERNVYLVSTEIANFVLAKYSNVYDQTTILDNIKRNASELKRLNKCSYSEEVALNIKEETNFLASVDTSLLDGTSSEINDSGSASTPPQELDEESWLESLLCLATGNCELNADSMKKYINNIWKISSIDTICKRLNNEKFQRSLANLAKCKICVGLVTKNMCRSGADASKSALHDYATDNLEEGQTSSWYYTRPFVKRILAQLIKCGLKEVWGRVTSNSTIKRKLIEFFEKNSKNATKTPSTLKSDLLKAIKAAACNVGFNIVANTVDDSASPDKYYEEITFNSCDFFFFLSQIAACSKSAAGFCDAIFNPGYVDLSGVEKWLAEKTALQVKEDSSVRNENEAVSNVVATLSNYATGEVGATLISSTASAVIQELSTKLGGPLGGAAVSIIGMSIKQIQTSILTGTNDWAHCVGTDRMGACIGTKWANYTTGTHISSYADSHIAPSVVVKNNKTGENMYVVGDYCMCDRICKIKGSSNNNQKLSYKYFYRTQTKRSSDRVNFLDTDTQNACKDNNQKTYKQTYGNYDYMYTNCQLVRGRYPYNTSKQNLKPGANDEVTILSYDNKTSDKIYKNIEDEFNVCGQKVPR